MDNINRSDFDIDLRYGQKGEVLVNSLLTAPIETVEVKRDKRWKNTGNLFIEVWCWSDNKSEWYPSGLQTSKATHWAFVLEEMTVIVPTDQLKKTVEKYGHPIECSIPPNYSKGYLIKVTDLLQVARGF
jgi:hypothetical protein